MRTTLRLDDDVAAAVEGLRREKGLGMSEAVNRLVRNGLRGSASRHRIRLEATNLGLRIDVSNVAEALDVAEAGSQP